MVISFPRAYIVHMFVVLNSDLVSIIYLFFATCNPSDYYEGLLVMQICKRYFGLAGRW